MLAPRQPTWDTRTGLKVLLDIKVRVFVYNRAWDNDDELPDTELNSIIKLRNVLARDENPIDSEKISHIRSIAQTYYTQPRGELNWGSLPEIGTLHAIRLKALSLLTPDNCNFILGEHFTHWLASLTDKDLIHDVKLLLDKLPNSSPLMNERLFLEFLIRMGQGALLESYLNNLKTLEGGEQRVKDLLSRTDDRGQTLLSYALANQAVFISDEWQALFVDCSAILQKHHAPLGDLSSLILDLASMSYTSAKAPTDPKVLDEITSERIQKEIRVLVPTRNVSPYDLHFYLQNRIYYLFRNGLNKAPADSDFKTFRERVYDTLWKSETHRFDIHLLLKEMMLIALNKRLIGDLPHFIDLAGVEIFKYELGLSDQPKLSILHYIALNLPLSEPENQNLLSAAYEAMKKTDPVKADEALNQAYQSVKDSSNSAAQTFLEGKYGEVLLSLATKTPVATAPAAEAEVSKAGAYQTVTETSAAVTSDPIVPEDPSDNLNIAATSAASPFADGLSPVRRSLAYQRAVSPSLATDASDAAGSPHAQTAAMEPV